LDGTDYVQHPTEDRNSGTQFARVDGRRSQAIPRGVYASTPLFVRHAEGAMLEDVDGNRFIDLGGGIGCATLAIAIRVCSARCVRSSMPFSISAFR
jgi:4-aminobutyrate aminotransferase/(S)-3-amino-2-methylpropionate transaminase